MAEEDDLSTSGSGSTFSVIEDSDDDNIKDKGSKQSIQKKNSWMARTFERLIRQVGKPSTLIGFLLILASIFMGWIHVALAVVTILGAKAKFFPVKEICEDLEEREDLEDRDVKDSEVEKNEESESESESQESESEQEGPQRPGLSPDLTNLVSAMTSTIAHVQNNYEKSSYMPFDCAAGDFEMDPAMVTNEKKIEWKGDGTSLSGAKILEAYNEGNLSKNESKNEMPKYDSKEVPKEFVDVDPNTFLQDPRAVNLCFLPTDTFIRICSMLPVSAFLNLSSTCRFLRWRMFAFCTCYIRNPVIVKLKTDKIIKNKKYAVMPSKVYEHSEDFTGFFAFVPPCFKKPFFCETLVIKMEFHTYEEDDYDRALSVVLPLRPFARRVIVHQDSSHIRSEFLFPQDLDYLATDNFYKTLNISSVRYWDEVGIGGVNIFNNCPFTRKMDMAWIDGDDHLVDGAPLNRIGYYCNAETEQVKSAIDEFLYGEKNLEFHVYFRIREPIFDNRYMAVGFYLLDYLFARYDDWEEYFFDRADAHLWYTTIQENGRRLKMRIYKKNRNTEAEVMIGKEELFDKMEQNYNSIYCKYREQYIRDHGDGETDEVWKMETAVEPEE